MSETSSISISGIEERAQKLEADMAAVKPETPAEETHAEPEAAAPAAATVPGQAPVVKVEEKKAPNDPDELRKWNTKVSMELADVKKQLQTMAETLNKTSKKQIDWKDLAKDPVKLQAAIEEQRKQDASEYEEKFNKSSIESTTRITRLENMNRFHDPAYPRWAELNDVVKNLALTGDKRVDFSQDPATVLDQMYEIAKTMHPTPRATAAPAAPVAKSYTDADLAAAKEEARKEAIAEAQKGLANEAKGQGVAGMGKGVAKGKTGPDKEALWNMPIGDLKRAIQQASDK